ncbi:MAG: shikimate kinase [Chromatiales bacterium]|nr:shikimate kinase [Chromatiales bacterium]
MNIFLIGPMATGKSCIGNVLAQRLRLPFYDTDDLICLHAAMDIPTIFEKEGESGFRKREATVLRELADHRDMVVATGGGAVMDEQNCKYIKENGTVVYLNTPLGERYKRIQPLSGRPLLMDGNAHEVMQELDNIRVPIYQALADFVVDNSGDVDATTRRIIEYINEMKRL